MGVLAERLSFLARRYGSDPSAWQRDIHAVASLEASDQKAALDMFHALKRRLAEFRRSQLFDALREFPFVSDLPPQDTRGYPINEIEAEIRQGQRALTHARAIAAAQAEESAAREALRLRQPPPPQGSPSARWDALAPLVERTEAHRRATAREARLDRRLGEAQRRAKKQPGILVPDASWDAALLDAALDACEAALTHAETLQAAYRTALDPVKTPEVATYRGESKRALEREAAARLAEGDVEGLRALAVRGAALRTEAASLASQAARSRRKGLAAPERERRSSDTMDGYG